MRHSQDGRDGDRHDRQGDERNQRDRDEPVSGRTYAAGQHQSVQEFMQNNRHNTQRNKRNDRPVDGFLEKHIKENIIYKYNKYSKRKKDQLI